MKTRLFFVSAVVALASVSIVPGCALFQASNTPSSQVIEEVRLAETAYLSAITIINIRNNGKVSEDTKAAEQLVYSYLEAAREAATKGDVVTVNQKLDLFNAALTKFNESYVNATTRPAQ